MSFSELNSFLDSSSGDGGASSWIGSDLGGD
jgi:hypothetical protein